MPKDSSSQTQEHDNPMTICRFVKKNVPVINRDCCEDNPNHHHHTGIRLDVYNRGFFSITVPQPYDLCCNLWLREGVKTRKEETYPQDQPPF